MQTLTITTSKYVVQKVMKNRGSQRWLFTVRKVFVFLNVLPAPQNRFFSYTNTLGEGVGWDSEASLPPRSEVEPAAGWSRCVSTE